MLRRSAMAFVKVLKQYLTEFMLNRRESNILSSSSRIADDGKLYYQVEVNIKSYGNTNELAVMPTGQIGMGPAVPFGS
ncbi:hypothetical protein GQ457_11G016010 [Hibiscus cannabinus]